MVCTPALPGVDDPDATLLDSVCQACLACRMVGWYLPQMLCLSVKRMTSVTSYYFPLVVEFVGHYSAIAWTTTKTDFSWRKDVVIWCLESGQPSASRHLTWKRLWAVYSWIRLEGDLVSLSLSLLWLYSIVLLSLCITLTFLRLSSFDCFFLFHSALFSAYTQ